MTRWLLVFTVMTLGCVATLPAGDTSITADLACEAARTLVQMRRAPAPAPKPDDGRCDTCKGTGKLGDGRVSVTCPACDGTGKKKAAKPAPTCTTGSCPLP